VEREEWLRERCRAIVSCVAGIDGPGRNPVGWIRQGRIGHCHRFIPHHASDGAPRRWSGIMAVAAARWGAATPLPDTPLRAKRIGARKRLTELGCTFRHPDRFPALQELERMP
jgi:hypothetical protein